MVALLSSDSAAVSLVKLRIHCDEARCEARSVVVPSSSAWAALPAFVASTYCASELPDRLTTSDEFDPPEEQAASAVAAASAAINISSMITISPLIEHK